MTNIAILCLSKDSEIEANLISKLAALQDVKLYVYSKDRYEAGVHGLVENVEIPADCDTLSKMHNFIVKDQFNRGFSGILHVIEDNVVVKENPAQFISDIAKMMTAIDIKVWLNTVCDGMNYVYSKYNPRLIVEFDDPKWQTLGLDGMVFTSHSNMAWIAYDMSKFNESEYLFDEQFSVRMFMIIEFLARRKALNKSDISFCLMNMYPTVKSENGVFRLVSQYDDKTSDDIIKEQNDKFTSMRLDIAPDNLIDNVLERLYKIFKQKEDRNGNN